ncbi:uncharacterized protein LOC111083874 [Limulus polyphemus]|uniref:Uncharacterized protein LOC111083874 n=1 Tax=Limulus polyphemus TaxID=6850 RepID=A0ABM1RY44_LIMPO|nr:uncharacterized protein LOC111083874 [Limulus polyphemus]
MTTSPSFVQVKRPDVPGLPECAPQQVCNAMFLRLNHTQHLCNCPSSFPNPCPVSQDQEDGHTLNLVADKKGQVLTSVKICDPILTIKTCDAQQDWMLLALQSMRTGKAHYLVICQCPSSGELIGPISHENPPYADIPGIRVFGMICARGERSARRSEKAYPEVPWDRIINFMNTTVWRSEL